MMKELFGGKNLHIFFLLANTFIIARLMSKNSPNLGQLSANQQVKTMVNKVSDKTQNVTKNFAHSKVGSVGS